MNGLLPPPWEEGRLEHRASFIAPTLTLSRKREREQHRTPLSACGATLPARTLVRSYTSVSIPSKRAFSRSAAGRRIKDLALVLSQATGAWHAVCDVDAMHLRLGLLARRRREENFRFNFESIAAPRL